MYIALTNIKTDRGVLKPGDAVKGLSKSDLQELLDNGCIALNGEAKPQAKPKPRGHNRPAPKVVAPAAESEEDTDDDGDGGDGAGDGNDAGDAGDGSGLPDGINPDLICS